MIEPLRTLPLLALSLVLMCSQAIAQPAQNRRIRGTVESLDSNVLMVKARDGTDVKIRLADNWAVISYTKAQIADIKVGTFIGVGGTPQPRRQPEGGLNQYLSRERARSGRGLSSVGSGAERNHDQCERC